ncbi:hypothetical protein BFJ63_vAg14488 [Fusarium oxysporum f. sp. narcissi]|uniref:Uncharacterized protein n=1 Tax=Fusarium oxysporum f. sp. narcissi TaxID=451672 RepID=A0A4Q2V7X2_FUSOX|nr:hypothetical protein BFJ67_g2772 [Fusarium oxysporum f. sp. cepae]RKK59035.1 hypothetical protein BFJ66_g2447 [Fusarium oxysporum f. sp. cepae]RYC82610.1 hypothetical protein BFJ63_vAg14488 [Fusarium oxysporum f. sp. narcissi]
MGPNGTSGDKRGDQADPAPQTRITWSKIERHPKEEVSSAVCKGSLLRLPMTLCNGASVSELL